MAFNSIDDAIAKDAKICVPGVLLRTFSKKFPRGKFINTGGIEDLPKALLSGRCSGIVTSQEQLKMMHSGKIKEGECSETASKDLTAEQKDRFCGKLRDDCDLNRVGDILHTVPLSFPVSDRLMRSLSWGVIDGHDNGKYAESLANNSDVLPMSQCGDMQQERETRLTHLRVIFVGF